MLHQFALKHLLLYLAVKPAMLEIDDQSDLSISYYATYVFLPREIHFPHKMQRT